MKALPVDASARELTDKLIQEIPILMENKNVPGHQLQ